MFRNSFMSNIEILNWVLTQKSKINIKLSRPTHLELIKEHYIYISYNICMYIDSLWIGRFEDRIPMGWDIPNLSRPALVPPLPILMLTNCTLLTADTILRCTKNPVPNWFFSFLFHRKNYNSCSYSALFTHLNSCTHTKSNLYLLIPWLLL
jgi:hypothetical protein